MNKNDKKKPAMMTVKVERTTHAYIGEVKKAVMRTGTDKVNMDLNALFAGDAFKEGEKVDTRSIVRVAVMNLLYKLQGDS